MKCYYEILDVARDADDAEIKTSYRKLALKWHPDKNLDNVELAKEQFQLVQQAYEVLSDRHERAWYDNHREQILRGSDSNFEDDCLDVFQYFTTQCFKGYGDDEKGFYTVYRKVFEQIAKEDIEYMDSKSDYDEIPVFGSSTSDYEEVVGPFYAYWMSYTTRKSYVWLDPYNINETRERRVLKLIEKENKKVRQKAKKERNEEIRNLVAFVRKRDKRVLAYSKQLEIKNAENRQKQEDIRKQKILERKKEIHTKPQAEWSKFDNVQRELKEIEKNLAAQFGEDLSESDEENSIEEREDLYCVACNKIFKNPRAFANHESSKKHKENVEKIKIQMQEEDEYDDVEDEDILEEEEIKGLDDFSTINQDDDLDIIDEINSSINNKEDKIEIDEDIASDVDLEEINLIPKKRSKKNKKVIRIHNHSISEDLQHSDKEAKSKLDVTTKSDDDFDFGSSKKQKKKNKNKQAQVENATKTTEKTNGETKVTEDGASATETNDNYIPPTKKQINNKTKSNKNKTPIDLEDIDTSHVCVTCKSNFSSKNKLFDHLKKTGHSVLINQQKPAKSKKKVK